MKKIAVQILKFALATGLIYWLIATKKITAEPFFKLWSIPWLIPFVFAVIFLIILINNYRWLLLLQGQEIRATARQTLPLTFIGLFFNLAMPGSVGGDVIKAYYIAQDQSGTKLKAATSVLMDRVVGLYAMAILALAAAGSNPQKIVGSYPLKILALFVTALFAGFSVFFIIGFSDRVRSHDFTNKVLERLPAGKILERIYDAIHAFRHGKRQFILGIALSLIVQSMSIGCFYILAKFLHFDHVTLAAFFFVIPLGLIATAVPISPAGLGVGQTVFLALFNWYTRVDSQLGPTVITIFQVVQAMWGLLGAVFYFIRKNHEVPNTIVRA